MVFDALEKDTAELIGDTAVKALALIQESWGLGPPADCRIYIMTSWWRFMFQSAPWFWRILVALGLPFWGFRARRTWPYSGAWTIRYGKRVSIGIKPPRLLEISDKSIGVRMFVEEKETPIKTQHLACHELTHACSAPLKLPAWLNEGLAAVTVDRFLGKRTIRMDTLELIRTCTPKRRPPTYRELSRLKGDAFVYHAVRGYWLVQYLEEKHPGFLRRALASRRAVQAIDSKIAVELGIELQSLWNEIDDLMVAHFLKAANVEGIE